MKYPKVSIIIVNYNGKKFLNTCINSINKTSYPNFETILVDNNSFDDSIKLFKKRSDIRLIENKKNFGFSTANNQAAAIAKGDYLFFLNNDTELPTDTIHKLAAAINKNSSIGVATCKIKSYDGQHIFHTGIGIDIFGFPVNKGKIFYAEGSVLMIRSDLFKKIGGFDDSYFMFHEDIDLCWKVHLLGFNINADPKAVVFHFAGGSAGGGFPGKNKYKSTILRRYYSERNNLATLLKNYSLITLILILPFYVLINFLEVILFLLTFKYQMAFYYLKAYIWIIINIKTILIKRNTIQKMRVVSDLEILKNMYFCSGKFLAFLKVGIPQFK